MFTDGLDISVEWEKPDFNLVAETVIPAQGITAIFGPSGSGKTSLLRLIAGFERPDRGHIIWKGQPWFKREARQWVPSHQRPVGLLFQDVRLLPHLSVKGNLDYADKRSDHSGSYDLDDIIAATDLGPLLSRRPATLSGGEAQRVALARTLLTRPDLLLFDEPLSALDTSRKAGLLSLLKTLPAQYNIPVIYISHDVDEVSHIANRVIRMEEGRITGSGPVHAMLAHDLFAHGRSPYDQISHLEGLVEKHQDGLLHIHVGQETIRVTGPDTLQAGDPVTLAISVQDVALATRNPEGLSIQNRLRGRITQIDLLPGSALCHVTMDIAGQPLTARITQSAKTELDLSPGQDIIALIKTAAISG